MNPPFDQERFRSKVDSSQGPDACWPWLGSRTAQGYGLYSMSGKLVLAHRAAAGLGQQGEGSQRARCVMHTCDQPACVNPAHLRVGTYQENMQDASAKGRIARGERNGGGKKLTAHDVRCIRARHAAGEAQRALARAFGVSQRMVQFIVQRKNWAHV